MVMRYTKPPTTRQLKIAEEIRHAISKIIATNELSHPFFEQNFFTVTEVRISSDLTLATIFILLPKNLDHKQTIKFFNEIAPKFRYLVTHSINIKHSPQLRFVADTAENASLEVDSLLKNL